MGAYLSILQKGLKSVIFVNLTTHPMAVKTIRKPRVRKSVTFTGNVFHDTPIVVILGNKKYRGFIKGVEEKINRKERK